MILVLIFSASFNFQMFFVVEMWSNRDKMSLKICEQFSRKKVKKPCKHWLFRHSNNNAKAHF